jgi:hypothetical protein
MVSILSPVEQFPHGLVDLPPSVKGEVPNAEVRPFRQPHRVGGSRQKMLLDITENLRH